MLKRSLVLIILAFVAGLASAQQVSNSNYTVQQANATISQVTQYVNTVNESGYLIFEPNLSAAYRYLNKAISIYNMSPNTAVIYADNAYASAHQEYISISYYRTASLPIMIAFTVAMTILLYRFMVPVSGKAKTGKGKGHGR